MTAGWTASAMAAATGGTWLRQPPQGWRSGGFCYAPALFIAGDLLVVRHREGELGMPAALAARLLPQAAGVICGDADQALAGAHPCLVVTDTRQALFALAGHRRSRYHGKVFAVTGSAGKTSTCEMLSHVLRQQGGVAATTHNTNLPPGVARVMAALPEDADNAVLELAIGRMRDSAALARPHVALFLNVFPVHLGTNTTLEMNADAKANIFTGLEPGGAAIVNRDMALFERIAPVARRHAAKVLTYGEHETADLRLLDYAPRDRLVHARLFGEEIRYRLGLAGRHMALNSLAVLGAVGAAGRDWRRAAVDLAAVGAVAGRGAWLDLTLDGREILLIDDAYNANPGSMLAGLNVLGTVTPTRRGRRLAVLGDMLELGSDWIALHRNLLEPLQRNGVDRVYTLGERMSHLWRALPPAMRGHRAASVPDLVDRLRRDLRDGDAVLVKGSHGSQVHKAVEALVHNIGVSPSAPVAPEPAPPSVLGGGRSRFAIDAATGTALLADGADRPQEPAGLVKLAGLYLVLEALTETRLAPTDRLAVSAWARKIKGGHLGLEAHEDVLAHDAVSGMAVCAANDAVVVLAEHLAGSTPGFIARQQDLCRHLGLTATRLATVSGLRHANQYTTARDMATLGRALVRDHPGHLHWLAVRSFVFDGKVRMSTNSLLGRCPGLDGLAMTVSVSAGAHMVAAATRGGRSVVAAVMGCADRASLHQAVCDTLDEAFSRPSA